MLKCWSTQFQAWFLTSRKHSSFLFRVSSWRSLEDTRVLSGYCWFEEHLRQLTQVPWENLGRRSAMTSHLFNIHTWRVSELRQNSFRNIRELVCKHRIVLEAAWTTNDNQVMQFSLCCCWAFEVLQDANNWRCYCWWYTSPGCIHRHFTSL